MKTCPVCDTSLKPGIQTWHLECGNCGYEGSLLKPRILAQKQGGDLDEAARENALASLRRANFSQLGKLIKTLDHPACVTAAHKPRLLDVGLYSRIRYSGRTSPVSAAFLTAGLSALIPFLAMLPADIHAWVFRKLTLPSENL
jgi:hypothetical protein